MSLENDASIFPNNISSVLTTQDYNLLSSVVENNTYSESQEYSHSFWYQDSLVLIWIICVVLLTLIMCFGINIYRLNRKKYKASISKEFAWIISTAASKGLPSRSPTVSDETINIDKRSGMNQDRINKIRKITDSITEIEETNQVDDHQQ